MPSPTSSQPTHVWAAAAPAVVLIAIAIAEYLGGRDFTIIGLVVVAPLLAANLVGPRLSAAYGVAALAVALVLGLPTEGELSAGERNEQVVRAVSILLAGIVAVWVSARRVRRETRLAQLTRVAHVAQRAILAPIPPVVGPVRCAVLYVSAASESTVGGDAYAALVTPFGARLLVADVRGKGLDAVRMTTHVLGAFRERAHEREDLAMLLDDLDAAVRRAAQGEDFVTAVLAQVDDDGRLTLINAGHPPPLLLRERTASWLQPPVDRPPLGLAGATLPLRLQLEADDRLLLYTDGLTEARHPKDRRFFPLDDLAASTLGNGMLEAGLDSLSTALHDWVGHRLGDDVALLAVELAEPASEGPEFAAASPGPDSQADDSAAAAVEAGESAPPAPEAVEAASSEGKAAEGADGGPAEPGAGDPAPAPGRTR
ncbi:MAG TPA: PP2C family protein-serine/threonine phosphatase [Mycobacteriales bacterium]|nr:PP2C family protein-serine/threonine phosphatase [Mycobacteriales bacterium]